VYDSKKCRLMSWTTALDALASLETTGSWAPSDIALWRAKNQTALSNFDAAETQIALARTENRSQEVLRWSEVIAYERKRYEDARHWFTVALMVSQQDCDVWFYGAASMEPTADAAAIADAYVNSAQCFAHRLESLADESAGSADALQLDPVWAVHMRVRRNGKIADVRRRRAVSSLNAAIWLIRLAKDSRGASVARHGRRRTRDAGPGETAAT
jgi:hypothetical protein